MAPFPDPRLIEEEVPSDGELDEDLQQLATSLDDEKEKIEERMERLMAEKQELDRKKEWLHHVNAKRRRPSEAEGERSDSRCRPTDDL